MTHLKTEHGYRVFEIYPLTLQGIRRQAFHSMEVPDRNIALGKEMSLYVGFLTQRFIGSDSQILIKQATIDVQRQTVCLVYPLQDSGESKSVHMTDLESQIIYDINRQKYETYPI